MASRSAMLYRHETTVITARPIVTVIPPTTPCCLRAWHCRIPQVCLLIWTTNYCSCEERVAQRDVAVDSTLSTDNEFSD